MKTFAPYFLIALLLLPVLPALSQDRNRKLTGPEADSIQCGINISGYREFFAYELYTYAREPWKKAFNDCPDVSEKMYVDGVTMYRTFIDTTPDASVREGLIDTLMLIYDRRMEHFGGEGNVTGRKGFDLLTYRRSDPASVQEAHALLKRSIELEGVKSREPVLLNFISASITLKRQDLISGSEVIADYMLISGVLDQLTGTSSRWRRTRSTLNEIMQKERIFTCEALDAYFQPRFEQHNTEFSFLIEMLSYYNTASCNEGDLYLAAREELYRADPGPESAHDLAILYIAREDYDKATQYLTMAVIGDDIDNITLAEWFYELAVVSSARTDYCDAISYAREAIANKKDLGKAYLTLGDAIIASGSGLEDEFERRAAYWVAADKYREGATVDPSVSEEAMKKLSVLSEHYPDKEEIFFRDLKEGDSHLVRGCINEYTTVRSSDNTRSAAMEQK